MLLQPGQILVEKGPRRVVHRFWKGGQLAIVKWVHHALLRLVYLAFDSTGAFRIDDKDTLHAH